MSDVPEPGYYERLDFNAPLSGVRADAIARELAAACPRTVLDLGCGWGELLLRTLAAAPGASGRGVDVDQRLLARGRANATDRGLDGRVVFEPGEAASVGGSADVVICVGSDHAFGDQSTALAALRGLVRPGGLALFGSGFWQQQPSVEQAAVLGMSPDDLDDLAGLVDLAIEQGFRPLTIQSANADEWAEFESSYLADRERWLLAHGENPGAAEIRAEADAHRTGWLRGYAGVLGFGYLTLGVPALRQVTAT